MRSWLSLMPCSNSQPLICSGDQRIWHNFASILRRNGAVSLLEPIAALTPITAHLSAHRALTDAQNVGDAFLADPALAQRINLTAILVRYSPVLPHRQPLAMSRGYPFIASFNYALDS